MIKTEKALFTVRVIKTSITFLIILLLSLYGVGAIFFCTTLSSPIKAAISALFISLVLLPSRAWRSRSQMWIVRGIILSLLYGWYFSIEPKYDAPWAADVARLPLVELSGDSLRIKNIRNFSYRSESDFDVSYYDKTYDLSKLKSIDLFLSYWGTTSIAHTIVSFGFENDEQLAISIETRKEIGEEYSAVKGFFNTFELIYIAADERDVIGVRAKHRKEDVYAYRIRPTPEQAKTILLEYANTMNQLSARPQFYNALTKNCTTSFIPYINAVSKLKFNWAMIANGYMDRWRYDEGAWGFDIPFDEFRKQSHINNKVLEALSSDSISSQEFSKKIREDLPSIRIIAKQKKQFLESK